MYRVPLIDDELLARRSPTAKVELTESELRMIAHALSHAAVEPPVGWSDPVDRKLLEQEAHRFARVFQELRREAMNANGAATAATVTAPLHQEVGS